MPRRPNLLQGLVRMSYSQIIFVWVVILLAFTLSYTFLSYVPGGPKYAQ